MSPIRNSEVVIDSRLVLDRIDEIETTLTVGTGELHHLSAELDSLLALCAAAEPYSPDWQYGAVLVRDSYFVTYAKELAEDLGAISADAEWPLRHIDWEAAAVELKADYTAVWFDGVKYWVR